MDTTKKFKAKTLAEMLPDLSGILTKDSIYTLTGHKQPRPKVAQTNTAEKVHIKPMTIAEMREDILAVKREFSKKIIQAASPHRKKTWNSSVKLEKKFVNHTANGYMKHHPAKKMLNFQPKLQILPNSKAAVVSQSPKFPKPELKLKKTLPLQAANHPRISGISHIPQTPINKEPLIDKIILTDKMILADKENMSKLDAITKISTPKPIINKNIPKLLDTPLLNESWKSSCDSSFLQKEKEINDIEMKTNAIAEEHTIANIAEVSPPICTPFKGYRSFQENFNLSNDLENSAVYNDTIMCFNKTTECKDKREEIVIDSLCDLMNKATMNSYSEKKCSKIDELLNIEKHTENNIKMIEKSISALNSTKESHLQFLQYIRVLITEMRENKTLNEIKETPKGVIPEIVRRSSKILSKPCSVIRYSSKSPSYKVPKKNVALRKTLFCKSLPNISNRITSTPMKSELGNRALSVYMNMKEHMSFLNTPGGQPSLSEMLDTPAITSHNLQKQLNKLYDEN